jgi:hypothetical protein
MTGAWAKKPIPIETDRLAPDLNKVAFLELILERPQLRRA